MMARPSKYSPERAATIAEAIEKGLTFGLAAALGGISPDTLTVWRRRYPDFAERIDAAEAQGALVNITKVRDAANDDWRAAAWILEHRHPHQYGKTVTENQLTGKDGEMLTVRSVSVPLPIRQDDEV
jgi:hypothetical protein